MPDKAKAGRAGHPYRPTSGREGMAFMERFCHRCSRNGEAVEDPCEILQRVMAHTADAPGYPPEWTYDDSGRPTCTAFLEVP